MKYTNTSRGFTLIELLVAVIIIAILAAIALPRYKHAILKSKFSAVILHTKNLADAQEVFYLNNGKYTEDKEALDLSLLDARQTTVTLSNKKNYKYVMGHHTSIPGANYIIYQKHSKRFADNIHCEALKTDDDANWLCEKGLGGTPITGSISGNNFATYLLSGNAGTDKFVREDCPEGYYDKDGQCTITPKGYYAEDGERKLCPPGTSNSVRGSTSCEPCPLGYTQTGQDACLPCQIGYHTETEGSVSCKLCPAGTSNTTRGAASCDICPAGTSQNGEQAQCVPCTGGYYSDEEGSTSCKQCPKGTYSSKGATSCDPCPAGQYAAAPANSFCYLCGAGYYSQAGATSCSKCPSGQTNNEDHSGCVPA